MKKITVALEDSAYDQLIDYVAARSKRQKSRFSVSQSASELIIGGLSRLQPVEGSEAR